MLNYHNTDDLRGKVSNSILKEYTVDYTNFGLSSIIAGFHRAYGARNEGIKMSLEITNDIHDGTLNLCERNILLWNLYILSREFIDDGEYEKALKIIQRAEDNWTRDAILGDEIGVYHVSWIEQFWIRRCEVYLLSGDDESFQIYTDRIINSRFEYFKNVNEGTGETIIGDRCTYNTFEIMAFQERRRNVELAIKFIKQAIYHKMNIPQNIFEKKFNSNNNCNYKLFDMYLQLFIKIPDKPFNNISYGYCKTCSFYSQKNKCKKFNITTDEFKACSHFNI